MTAALAGPRIVTWWWVVAGQNSGRPPDILAADMQVWEVRDAGRQLVLRFANQAGPIVGTGARAPGTQPPRHPFLTAIFLDSRHETHLRRFLGLATDPADFTRQLRTDGYSVSRFDD